MEMAGLPLGRIRTAIAREAQSHDTERVYPFVRKGMMKDEASFLGESAYVDMLLMPLFHIGELAGALSEEYRTSHRAIPWHAVVGF